MSSGLFTNPQKKRTILFWIGLFLVVLLAMMPRLYPVSRPMQWYGRSVSFWDALLEGDWAGTYQQYHPGVTTMWIAGAGFRFYALMHGWSGADLHSPPYTSEGPGDYPIGAGVAALGFVVALCIGLLYVLLLRLTNWPIAFTAGCLMALDPFYIAQSQVLHLDALLASLMLISAIALLCYLCHGKGQYLVLSGIFAGLAALTKSPSGFLIPYTILGIFAFSLSRLRVSEKHTEDGGKRSWRFCRVMWNVIRVMVVWGIAAGITFVLLWPAMWLDPVGIASRVVREALFRVETPHEFNFFAGQVFEGDPGWLYYGATLAWKTTLITLPAACLAVFFLLRRWKRPLADPIWWTLIYTFGFSLMMTIAAKKGLRYLLPAFPAFDILAAWGLVTIAVKAGRWKRLPKSTWGPTVIVATCLVIQGGATLRHHPYYGTHHNLLLGGSSVAQHILPMGDQGEGTDLAAHFLNSYPNAGGMAAGLQNRSLGQFRREFVGQALHIGQSEVDYWVFVVNANQRGLEIEFWEDIWEKCQQDVPLWSVSFDGVPYIWIYRAYPHRPEAFPIEHRLDAGFGAHISLLGYRLDTDALSAPGVLTVTLFWQSDGRVVDDYHVFVHLVDSEGRLVAQHDGVPATGERPANGWRDAEVVRDEHEVILDADLPGGAYTLYVGLYDFLTGVRVPASSATDEHLAEDCILLEQIRVPE
jgi:hypothetical protein